MGTMLITSSTPRITYKIGMRSGGGAVEDRPLPGLRSGAPAVKVAAAFTGIYRILMWTERGEAKTVRFSVTKVPLEVTVWRGFGNKT